MSKVEGIPHLLSSMCMWLCAASAYVCPLFVRLRGWEHTHFLSTIVNTHITSFGIIGLGTVMRVLLGSICCGTRSERPITYWFAYINLAASIKWLAICLYGLFASSGKKISTGWSETEWSKGYLASRQDTDLQRLEAIFTACSGKVASIWTGTQR